MKRLFPLFLVVSATVPAQQPIGLSGNGTVAFTENAGQVHDQNLSPRPDVLFGGKAGALNFHLRQHGVSYQLLRRETPERTIDIKRGKPIVVSRASIYRMEVEWVNSLQARIEPGVVLDGVQNFISAGAGRSVEGVQSFASVKYADIYRGIDAIFYSSGGVLKYDFIVAPWADPSAIRLKVKGATRIVRNSDGSIDIKSPFGSVNEGRPVVTQDGRKINARWIIKNDELSFEIGAYDRSRPLVIDPPTRSWGTYYGDSAEDYGYGCNVDGSGNIYNCGSTEGATGTVIATSGAYQTSFGGIQDAYLVKFNSAGVRQWATFYGDSDFDLGIGCTNDASGNVYMCGLTGEVLSSTIIATTGAHQTAHGGVLDAFLVKFSSSGSRLWSTYYGGSGIDFGWDCAVDGSGNVCMAGFTDSNNGTSIATNGAHQTVFNGLFDAFLVKFNSSGARQWGTYYGDADDDEGYSCATDGSGDVYLCGITGSSLSIATSTAHQAAWAGSFDGFLVKFNGSGVRQWGTYYGASGDDQCYHCTVDGSNNVYVTGATDATSGTVIATTGAHQTSSGGSIDALVAKFNTNGVRQWGTFFGGSGDEWGVNISAGSGIFISGNTSSGSGIATTGAHQTSFGGGSRDGMIMEFNTSGALQWASYYGGNDDEDAYCAAGPSGEVAISGNTYSGNGTTIATSGSHQSSIGSSGFSDGYIARFGACTTVPPAPTNTTPASAQQICAGNTTTLQVSGTGVISWYPSASSTSAIATGTAFVTPTLAAGTYSYYAEAFSCSVSATRAMITVTVISTPTVSLSASPSSVCAGGTVTLTATGAQNYTWSANTTPNGSVATAMVSGASIYSVMGTSAGTCAGNAVISITPSAPSVSLSAVNPTLCAGETVTLTASGGLTYVWSSNATPNGSVATATASASTSYSVTGTNAQGCTASAVINITVQAVPVLSVTTNHSVLCTGSSATLSASGAQSYSWSGAATGSGATLVITPTANATYTLTGSNGCVATAAITQTVSTCPGFKEYANAALRVYPNPNDGRFTVNSPVDQSFVITDVLGRRCGEGVLRRGENTVAIERRSKGVYMLSTDAGGTLKLVVE
jgi:hypothetical protein